MVTDSKDSHCSTWTSYYTVHPGLFEFPVHYWLKCPGFQREWRNFQRPAVTVFTMAACLIGTFCLQTVLSSSGHKKYLYPPVVSSSVNQSLYAAIDRSFSACWRRLNNGCFFSFSWQEMLCFVAATGPISILPGAALEAVWVCSPWCVWPLCFSR